MPSDEYYDYNPRVKLTRYEAILMINPELVLTNWSAIATEAIGSDQLFAKLPLADAVATEFSLETGNSSRAFAAIRSFFAALIKSINERLMRVSDWVASARYKTMSNRAQAVQQYFKTAAGKSNGNATGLLKKIYSYDSDFKNGFDNALQNLNHYLQEPFVDVNDFIYNVGHNTSPPVVAYAISKRSKIEGFMNPDQLEKLITAINKILVDSKDYDWMSFQDPNYKFKNVDELRFVLGDHDLMNDNNAEFQKVSNLVRGLYDTPIAKLKESTQIYNIQTNTAYIFLAQKLIPGTITGLREASKYVKKLEASFKTVSNVSTENDVAAAERMQSFVSMVGALTGYLGNISGTISRIDGYNAAVMTCLKYVDEGWLNKHIKDRGILGNGESEVDTQSYELMMREDGVFQMAVESGHLSPSVEAEMREYSDNYVKACAIESRILAYGVSIKDAVALEAMSPGCFKGQQITDMFDYKPSSRNVEVALEIGGLIKAILVSAMVTMIVKYLHQIIEFVTKKFNEVRKRRVGVTLDQFTQNIKIRITPQADFHDRNADVMANLQKQRNIDKTGKTNPSGHSHNSAVKPKVMTSNDDEVDISARRNLYKNVLVPLFKIDPNAQTGLDGVTDINDFLRFLNSTNVHGPALLSNDPLNAVNRLVQTSDQSMTTVRELVRGIQDIQRQVDSLIAGTSQGITIPSDYIPSLRNYLQDGFTGNALAVAKEVRERLLMEGRSKPLVGSPLFRSPELVEKTTRAALTFKDDIAAGALRRLESELKQAGDNAQRSLDRYKQVESDKSRYEDVKQQVEAVIHAVRANVEALGAQIELVSKVMYYGEALANASNIFIKG